MHLCTYYISGFSMKAKTFYLLRYLYVYKMYPYVMLRKYYFLLGSNCHNIIMESDNSLVKHCQGFVSN